MSIYRYRFIHLASASPVVRLEDDPLVVAYLGYPFGGNFNYLIKLAIPVHMDYAHHHFLMYHVREITTQDKIDAVGNVQAVFGDMTDLYH